LIFTIGYQALSSQRLLDITEALDALVIDVRSVPRSRKPGFSKGALGDLLGKRYLTMGENLGGRTPITAASIATLRTVAAERNDVILLCLEEAPGDCHRHATICSAHFPEAVHIYRDELFTARALDLAIARGPEVEYALCGSLGELIEDPEQSSELLP
jgi:uncharacterized protein (DUF488 family)